VLIPHAYAAELLQRAKQQWPTPVAEEALAHWTEGQRLAWRQAEKVCIEGEFDTLAKWIHGQFSSDKARFAGMYNELREFAAKDLTHSFVQDGWSTEAAKMKAQLVRKLSTIDADFRAEWFRIRWGESIDDYNGATARQGVGCLVMALSVVGILVSVVAWHSLRL
jgi:hypothetical protein